MAYEYLKGMGQFAQMGPASSSMSRPSGGTSSTNLMMQAQKFGTQVATQQPVKTIQMTAPVFGATAAATSVAPRLILQAVVFEPTVPAGSVKTDPGEREELKYWVKMTLGENSAFYLEKLKNDAAFTYMNANVLARYRNARTVVSDMLRGATDPNVTVSDVQAIRSWWKKCHPGTWYIFKFYTIKYPNFSAMWVPIALSQAYKTSYKTSGACPSGTPQRTLFEYKTAVTAPDLLKQEQKRQYDATMAKAAADREAAAQARQAAAQARQAASTAQASAADWKAKSETYAKQASDLQTNIATMQANIDTLSQQLASAGSPTIVADLQAQIAALTQQLAGAQAQVPVIATQVETAIAQSQIAETAAETTEQVATQTESIAEESSAAVEPWYIRNKWLLLLGAAGVGAGVWWYMKKRRETAVEPMMNRLPPPKSARRPSGLRNNPHSMVKLQDAVMRAIESTVGEPRIAVIVDNSGTMLATDDSPVIGALDSLRPITASYKTKIFVTKAYNGTDISSAMSDAYLQASRPNIIVVLTDGVTPWPNTAPPGVEVVIGIVGKKEDLKGFSMPRWVKRSSVFLG